jgi:hypothetical protein
VEHGYKHFIDGYLISNTGEVYSTKRNKKLKQFTNNKGYYRFQVYINGVRKWYFTHITVVNLFGDAKGKKMLQDATLKQMNWSIDHLDGDKSNNAQSNLEIVTHGKNIRRYHKKKR